MKAVYVNLTLVKALLVKTYVNDDCETEEQQRREAMEILSRLPLNEVEENCCNPEALCSGSSELTYYSMISKDEYEAGNDEVNFVIRCSSCDTLISGQPLLCNCCGCFGNDKRLADDAVVKEDEKEAYIVKLKKMKAWEVLDILGDMLGYKHLVYNPNIFKAVIDNAIRFFPTSWNEYLDGVIEFYSKEDDIQQELEPAEDIKEPTKEEQIKHCHDVHENYGDEVVNCDICEFRQYCNELAEVVDHKGACVERAEAFKNEIKRQGTITGRIHNAIPNSKDFDKVWEPTIDTCPNCGSDSEPIDDTMYPGHRICKVCYLEFKKKFNKK